MTHQQIASVQAQPEGIVSLDARSGWIATGGADGIVRLFTADGTETGHHQLHSDMVKSLRLSAEGRVASVDRAGALVVWDPRSDSATEIGRVDAWGMGVAWAPGGERLVASFEDRTLRIWDVARGEQLREVALERPANAVDWSSDGALIAAACSDNRLRLFSREGEQLRVIEGATQMLWCVRVSPDSTRVAWSGRDRVVRIASVMGEDARELGRHDQQVWSVAWDPTSQRVATGAADSTARLWSVEGRALERIESGSWVRGVSWTGDGLALGGDDGELRLYRDDGSPAPAPPPPLAQPAFDICPHIAPQVASTEKGDCEECGSTQALRLCLTCGHVGCCESQLAHSTIHWEATGHPNTTPTPPGRFAWRWCFECDDYVKERGRARAGRREPVD